MANIWRAFSSIRADWLLIGLYGVFSVRITGGVWTYVSLLGLVVAFLLEVIICGRIVARVIEKPIPEAGVLVLAHWRNVLSVTLVLLIPAITFSVVVPGVAFFVDVGLQLLLRFLIAVILVFALPIVFIKRTGLVSIPAALVFLRTHIRPSAGIIALVLIASLIPVARFLALPYLPAQAWIAYVFGTSVVAAFILFAAFAAATELLVSDSVGPSAA